MLTASEERGYNQALDALLKRVERNLDTVRRRRLNAEQKSTVERIQAFVRQAVDLRAADLVTAHSLATRADLLALDLARTAR